MQEVVMWHLLKKGLGLHVSGHVEVYFLWQVTSHWEDTLPLSTPSSHSSCDTISSGRHIKEHYQKKKKDSRLTLGSI